MKYDYLIVGAGLFGATLAHELLEANKTVLVVEKSSHVGGACFTECVHNINIHRFGAHIFRTDSKWLWDYVNNITTFKPFVNSPLAYVDGKMYNLPFNMNTFNQLWGIYIPEDAKAKIESEIVLIDNPQNAKEYALATVGKTIYKKFIKHYTEKQWGKKCKDLPPSILGRLPIRYTFDNNYYQGKKYQGVPVHGYTTLINELLNGSMVLLNTNGRSFIKEHPDMFDKVIYTGSIDSYYNYIYGMLEYRSLRFEEVELYEKNHFGNAVINYPGKDFEFTRQIEHKHFLGEESDFTIISTEYPEMFDGSNERYYPIETDRNLELYNLYKSIDTDIIFAGRLGSYKYTDMEQTIINARALANDLIYNKKGERI